MSAAACNGHLHIVEFLRLNRPGERCNGCVADTAAARGHLDVVKFLYETHLAKCTSQGVDEAATNGHLDVVQYLHSRQVRSTGRAMDGAVRNRHFEIIEWLRENYHDEYEGCTGAEMAVASRKNDLDTLRLLFQYRSEGSIEEALRIATKQNEPESVKNLFNSLPEGFTPRFLWDGFPVFHVTSDGGGKVVEYLHESERFPFTSEAMHSAAIGDHHGVVHFLNEHRSEGCRDDTLFICDARKLTTMVDFLCSQRPFASLAAVIARAKRERIWWQNWSPVGCVTMRDDLAVTREFVAQWRIDDDEKLQDAA
ncbi:hypothetical protein Gpo141_00005699 [Globisporangium polare]